MFSQTTSITTDSIAADRSKPSPLSANQIDVTGQHKTHQQVHSCSSLQISFYSLFMSGFDIVDVLSS